MYSRDAHPAYVSVINARMLTFRLLLNGASNPTLEYGSNWIASVTHAGGGNTFVVTLKDNIFAVIDSGVNLRDDAPNGRYATVGSFTNEASASPLTFTLATWVAGGGVLNDPNAMRLSGTITINNGNITTPGGN
jgi:hypothetical protein